MKVRLTPSNGAGFVGALLILGAYAASHWKRLAPNGRLHSLLNAGGSLLVAGVAWLQGQPAVLFLEGAWAAVSLYALLKSWAQRPPPSRMARPLAIVLQHDPDEGPALLGEALGRAGFELVVRYRELKPSDVEASLLVVLGGPMGASDTAAYPFLEQEIDLLQRRLALGRPNLGICLGAQLLAKAAGAEVMAGARGFELPASRVKLTHDGLKDPAFRDLPRSFFVPQWHQDTFAPVAGASWLALSAAYAQQCFRLGSSYGFQFHLELDARRLEGWCERLAADITTAGVSPEVLEAALREVAAAEAPLARLRRNLASLFAIASRSPSSVC